MYRKWVGVLAVGAVVGSTIALAVPVRAETEPSSCRSQFLSAEYAFAFEVVRAVSRQDCEPTIRERASGYLRSPVLSDEAVVVGAGSYLRIDLRESRLTKSEKSWGASAVIEELLFRREALWRMTFGLPEADEYRLDLPDDITAGMSEEVAEAVTRNQKVKEGVKIRSDLERQLMQYDDVITKLRDYCVVDLPSS